MQQQSVFATTLRITTGDATRTAYFELDPNPASREPDDVLPVAITFQRQTDDDPHGTGGLVGMNVVLGHNSRELASWLAARLPCDAIDIEGWLPVRDHPQINQVGLTPEVNDNAVVYSRFNQVRVTAQITEPADNAPPRAYNVLGGFILGSGVEHYRRAMATRADIPEADLHVSPTPAH